MESNHPCLSLNLISGKTSGRSDGFEFMPKYSTMTEFLMARCRGVFIAISWLCLLTVSTLCHAETNSSPKSLTESAEAVVVVEVQVTDYTATAHDGDMVAEARVLKPLKGPLKSDKTFTFSETAWVGPDYQVGEFRVLFLEIGKSSDESRGKSWQILSDLRAKSAFFIETNAIPDLTLESLEAVLASPKNARTNGLRVTITCGDLVHP